MRAARDTVLERHGRLDGLLLAAGLNTPRRRWDDQSLDQVRAVLDTNLTAVVTVVDARCPPSAPPAAWSSSCRPTPGGRSSRGGRVAYSASKTALGSVVRTLNQQEAQHGVRATHLCPGTSRRTSSTSARSCRTPDARARMLQPEDVGRTVAFVLGAAPHVRIDELVLSPVAQH